MPLQVVELTGADQQVSTTTASLAALNVRNASDEAAAKFTIYDGTSSSGKVLVPVSLAAGECHLASWPDGGLEVFDGVFLDVESGSFTGSVEFRGAAS